MRGMTRLMTDKRGTASVNFAVAVVLVAMPALYPAKTMSVLKGAQSSWEQVWTIDGLSGGRTA